MESIEVIAAASARLDRALAEAPELAGRAISRTRLKALIGAGCVRVDGEVADDAARRIAAGARLRVEIPAAAPAEPAGEDIPLAIVFEDADLVVIDKPAGLVVHPAAGHESGTLVNALIAHCGASLSGIGGVRRPGIVHRLDKDTSGLLVVAKTDAAHQGLARLFADHGRSGSLRREYLAIVWGDPAAASGMVEAALGRDPRRRERIAVVGASRGRGAVTRWRVLERLGEATLLSCRLETGRTHQIRVHMAHIGHPLLGDPLYAAGFRTKARRLGETARAALAGLGRQALHARTLGFAHPVSGDDMLFESPPPADFAAMLAALRGAA